MLSSSQHSRYVLSSSWHCEERDMLSSRWYTRESERDMLSPSWHSRERERDMLNSCHSRGYAKIQPAELRYLQVHDWLTSRPKGCSQPREL